LFSKEITEQITGHNLTPEDIEKQLSFFKRGFIPARLVRPATIDDGIKVLKYNDFDELVSFHHEAADAGRIMKFVPSSGAATRMFEKLETARKISNFKSLEDIQNFVNNGKTEFLPVLDFFKKMNRFAFFDDIIAEYKKHRKAKGSRKVYIEYDDLLDFLISPEGLNYSDKPKALVKFHKYETQVRTALEEHLAEAIGYSSNSKGKINIHFTISPEHIGEIESHVEKVLPFYESGGYKFSVTYSVQKKSTDTIAVAINNELFLDENGNLLFRPGGHGALLENLMEINGDIVFIKNIDNVVTEKVLGSTILYKKLLSGNLIKAQSRIFNYLRKIAGGTLKKDEIFEMSEFAEKELFIPKPADSGSDAKGLLDYYYKKLNRPIRVCGMVLNQGAPGGGPFWVKFEDNSVSLQIVESAQIDKYNSEQFEIFKKSTHFNPVDLVCGIRDFKGKPFDLRKFRDENAFFISEKAKNGSRLKALELPGLWNGSMADWITIFIEVPKITFSPVKEVNDLLLPEHQP